MKKHNDISVAGCIFSLDEKQILLIKRRDVPVWVLPGGGIDKGETEEEAIIREIKEETGYTSTIKRKIGQYTPVNRLTRLTHLYDLSIVKGSSTTSSETRDVKFFPLDQLPLMPPPYADWIKDACEKAPDIIRKKLSQITYSKLLYYLLIHPILVIRFLLSRIGLNINS